MKSQYIYHCGDDDDDDGREEAIGFYGVWLFVMWRRQMALWSRRNIGICRIPR